MEYRDLLAGNCLFTVSMDNGQSRNRLTYRITASEWKGNLNYLIKHRNQYLGMLDTNYKMVRLTKKSVFGLKDREVKIIKWALEVLLGNEPLPEGFSIENAGECFRCGRDLTTVESKASGYGPTCIKLKDLLG